MAGAQTHPRDRGEIVPPHVAIRFRVVLVLLAGFSFHLFRWFQRKPGRLANLIHGRGLRPSDWRSFARNGVGYAVGVLAVWLLVSWLVARRRGEPFHETLRKGSQAFMALLLFAPLAFLHYWPSMNDAAFVVQTAVLTTVAVALTRIYSLDVWKVFDGRTPWRRPGRWALILGAAFALDMIACSFYRFIEFTNHLDDLGLYDQMCWGLVHGYGFLTTIYPMPGDNFLAEHIMPTVAVFAQFYRIWDDPRLLLVLQSTALAGGGWLVYRIARKRSRTAFFPMLITVSFIINPLLERGWINDFHIDALEVVLYLAAYAFLLEGQGPRSTFGYWLAIALLLGCKEDVGLSVAALGFVVAIAHRRRATGFATFVVGIVWSYVAITKLLPHFASAGGVEIEMNRQLENYAHLGATPKEIALAPILHPIRVLKAMLFPDRLVSVLRVLGPVAFLPIASPLYLLLLGPSYLTTILSGWEGQYNLHTHYGLVFLAPAYIGAIEGWRRLEARWGERPRLLAGLAVAAACLALLTADEFRKFRLLQPLKWRHEYRTSIDQREVLRVGKLIPGDAALSVDEGLGPRFSARRYVFKFPHRPERTHFVLLNFRKENPLGDGRMADLRRAVVHMVREEGYGIRELRGDTLLLEKGYVAGNQENLLAKAISKIVR